MSGRRYPPMPSFERWGFLVFTSLGLVPVIVGGTTYIDTFAAAEFGMIGAWMIASFVWLRRNRHIAVDPVEHAARRAREPRQSVRALLAIFIAALLTFMVSLLQPMNLSRHADLVVIGAWIIGFVAFATVSKRRAPVNA